MSLKDMWEKLWGIETEAQKIAKMEKHWAEVTRCPKCGNASAIKQQFKTLIDTEVDETSSISNIPRNYGTPKYDASPGDFEPKPTRNKFTITTITKKYLIQDRCIYCGYTSEYTMEEIDRTQTNEDMF